MLIGKVLRRRYRIIRLLGSGGFGDTYQAEDLDLPDHPPCVVKHLKPKDPNPKILAIARRLFDHEAKILYQLGREHNQIPNLYAHFEEEGEFYLVQEFVDGYDLGNELIPGVKLSEHYAIQLLHDILEILAVMHAHNVIHRDIKPQNIMRRTDGKLVLIDFGAVKKVSVLAMNSAGQTSLTIPIGTPGYSPSEQISGHPKPASDLYAVGMIGIQALTGTPPEHIPLSPLTLELDWRPQAQVNDRLAEILDKMTRFHFSQRYQTATEILQALEALREPAPQVFSVPLSTIPPTDLSPPPPATSDDRVSHQTSHQTPKRTSRRNVLQTIGLVGLGIAAAIVGGRLLHQNAIDRRDTSESPDPERPDSPDSSSSPDSIPSLQPFQFEVVSTNEAGEIVSRSPGQARFFSESLGNDILLDMVEIPAGTVLMGSPESESGRGVEESPQREVPIPSFFMGKFEVTQTQYEAIVGSNPSRFQGSNRPVERVSWYEAVEFCNQLSQRTGRTYRLPSEAEWEYACRAGTTTPFHFGQTITTNLANYVGSIIYAAEPSGENRQQTVDVDTFPPNAFGLCDLHGNTWEWCEDVFHDSYINAPTDARAWVEGSDRADHMRVRRGGAWDNEPKHCRSAFRGRSTPDHRFETISFRVVCTEFG